MSSPVPLPLIDAATFMLARMFAGQLPGRREFVDWAVECLLENVAVPAITLLAGADHEEYAAVRSTFVDATEALGLGPTPGEADALSWAEVEICKRICDGTLAGRFGLTYLYSLWDEAGRGPRFQTWMYLQESIELMSVGEVHGVGPFTDMRPQEILPTIRDAAVRVVDRAGFAGPYRTPG